MNKMNLLNFFQRALDFYRSLDGRRRTVFIGAVLISGLSVLMIVRDGQEASEAIRVIRSDIAETVNITGQLKPVQSVELSFQSGGRVTLVPVKTGDRVSAGQLLASLDNAELSAQLRDAEANVLAQQARLDELVRGSRPEDILIKETEVQKAQQDLRNAYDNAYAVLSDGLTKAENAVHIQLEGMFDEVGTITYPAYKLKFSCFCDQLDLIVNEQRRYAEEALRKWQDDINLLASDVSNADTIAMFDRARQYLQTVKVMLENLNAVLNHPTVGLPAETAAAYKTSVNTARSTVIAAQVSVASQEQSILTYKLLADRAAGELARLRNGNTEEALTAQRAVLLSAQAQADRVRALVGRGLIRSPITGTVTRVDAKVGQSVAPNEVVISVVSIADLEMTANVPEVDIGKVAVGNPVRFTVDALPGESFVASVSYIDPAETVIDGVVNYEIRVTVPPGEPRLKSGLSTSVDILTRQKSGSLVVPQFALIENGRGTFVRRADGSESPVVVGIRSRDGMVEIVSGLAEGDLIMNVGLKSVR